MAKPILTSLREDLWLAIDNYEPLTGAFKRKIKFDQVLGMALDDVQPGPGELPCLAVLPSDADAPWTTNQGKQTIYTLEFRLWTPGFDVRPGERLWELIGRAIFQACPAQTTRPYVLTKANNVTYGDPKATLALVGEDDEDTAESTVWTWQVGMVYQAWQPNVETEPLD